MVVQHGTYPIGQFTLAYLVAILALALAAAITPPLGLLLYPVCGFALNRYILTKIQWHHVYDTVYNVSRAKIGAFLLWPIAYPRFLFQLFVSKYL